jgi:hypothetical protein
MPDLSVVDTIVIIGVVFTGVQTVVAVITFFFVVIKSKTALSPTERFFCYGGLAICSFIVN